MLSVGWRLGAFLYAPKRSVRLFLGTICFATRTADVRSRGKALSRLRSYFAEEPKGGLEK